MSVLLLQRDPRLLIFRLLLANRVDLDQIPQKVASDYTATHPIVLYRSAGSQMDIRGGDSEGIREVQSNPL